MIFWSGLGFLAAIVPVLCYAAVVKLAQLQYGLPYTGAHSWPGALGTLVGALAVFVLSEKLERPARTLVDTETREVVVFRKRHTLFFIPKRYWSIILVVVAVWMLVTKPDSPL